MLNVVQADGDQVTVGEDPSVGKKISGCHDCVVISDTHEGLQNST